MKFKSALKRVLLGPPGERPRKVYAGLLKGRRFLIDTTHKSMRLVGMDEREIVRCVRAAADGARTAVDVGAADGWYTVYFASQPEIGCVWGFEPDRVLLEQAQENLRLNSLLETSRIRMVARVVGSSENAHSVRLDTVLSAVEYPVVFKIDVDGGEMEVLRGARQVLTGGPCSLVIETHSPELETGCIEFLENLGYQCRIIQNAWYRALLPEARNLPHNRWLVGVKRLQA